MSQFTLEQQKYLEGFMSSVKQVYPTIPSEGLPQESVPHDYFGYDYDDLSKEEKIKFDKHGLDCWEKIRENSLLNKLPEDSDIFRYKFFGLFNVSPVQEGLMLRMRIPGGVLSAYQAKVIAKIANKYADGVVSITTRNNLQIREIKPEYALTVISLLDEIGLNCNGSGADNIRNVTSTPTSGFDKDELIDVLPIAKEINKAIRNCREMYNLPRKFNISLDSGSPISAASNTNDLCFEARHINSSEYPDTYFRVEFGGITGHRDFARSTDILLKPDQVTPYALATLRVFIKNGNRQNRKKARLKYLLDEWGIEKFAAEVEKEFKQKVIYISRSYDEPLLPKNANLIHGFHQETKANFVYAGINIPVGRLSYKQLNQLAELSEVYGKSELRLTVWQNLIIPHILTEDIEKFETNLNQIGLTAYPRPISAGVIACTGNSGCKFAGADTKATGLQIIEYLDHKDLTSENINIHLTGCHHSCAQHYCGDIGLLGCSVEHNGKSVSGYQIYLGGGMDNQKFIGRDLEIALPADLIPEAIESLFIFYKKMKKSDESFLSFTRRIPTTELKNHLKKEVLNDN